MPHRLRPSVLATAAASLQPSLMPHGPADRGWVATAAAATASLAGVVGGVALRRLSAGRLGGLAAALAGTAVGLLPPPADPIPHRSVVGRGIAWSLAAAGVDLAVFGPAAPGKARPLLRALAAGGVLAGAVGTLRTAATKAERDERTVEPGYGTPPDDPWVSGGPNSAVAFGDLGREGRRFVSERCTADDLAAVTGHAVEPVRVFVGFDSAPNPDDRVALALDDLERLGGFDRSLLVVASPAGSGYVNPVAVDAVEYLTGGDVATVAIGYGLRPSILSLDRIRPGARQFARLLEAIAGRPRRPRVVVYGESLGAFTSQDAFLGDGIDGLLRRGVDRALWVGTPYRSAFRHEVAADPRAGSYTSGSELLTTDADVVAHFLDHPEDPVTRFDLSLLTHRPSWLGPPTTRPPRIPDRLQWFPGATFWATAADTVRAADVVPGRFAAWGHDYRADLLPAVAGAYRLPTDHLDEIAAVLPERERARAARIGVGSSG